MDRWGPRCRWSDRGNLPDLFIPVTFAAASMRPQHNDRGNLIWHRFWKLATDASMRPRHDDRGNRCYRPIGLRDDVASMRPRHNDRGNSASGIPRNYTGLQTDSREVPQPRSGVPDACSLGEGQLGRNPFIHNVKHRCERRLGDGPRNTARGAAAGHLTRSLGRAGPRRRAYRDSQRAAESQPPGRGRGSRRGPARGR